MTENGDGLDQVSRWQAKLDREFPSGMVAGFRGGGSNYLISRPIVVYMTGLDPVVWLPVFSGSEKALGPSRVVSYEQVRNSPRAVRVMFENDLPMVWSAAVSPEAARAMAGERARSIAFVPNGGDKVLKGEPDA